MLPVVDLSDLRGCNTMQQHADQLLSLVEQLGQKRDAAILASEAVLNNKLNKAEMLCMYKVSRGQSVIE